MTSQATATTPVTVEKSHRAKLIRKAVRGQKSLKNKSLLEQLFAQMFSGLVYPQIWEDPLVDLLAMEIEPHHHIFTISSGGCNVLSYLTANPSKITAVDLNRAHVALTKTKLKAAESLENWDEFHSLFAVPNVKDNHQLYKSVIEPNLDETTRKHWQGRDITMRKRVRYFSENIYHHGMLGRFIGLCHYITRRYGINFDQLLAAKTREEQVQIFENNIAPLLDKKLIKYLTSHKASLYGLGIPPAQYEALAACAPGGNGDMAAVLRERLRKLCCDFEIDDNYFAWQAFGRRYGGTGENSLPPYLQQQHFNIVKSGASRVSVHQASITDQLNKQLSSTVDRVVLLDAQDWMDDQTLNYLWQAITMAATPKARVIFRTAGHKTILPGRIDPSILNRWSYLEQQSKALNEADRSAIYGGFHIYQLKD